MKRWNVRSLPIAAFVGVLTLALNTRIKAEEPQPELARLRNHVTTLASPAFEGRRGEGAVKAADYLVNEFKTLKLQPLFGESFSQEFQARPDGSMAGRNVGAILKGSDPAHSDEWVIVSAHYDHLGVRNGVLYPGADDNASGVAMMLELARSFVQDSSKPKRSLMFIGFDLEESGLFGSRYFVEHAPVPLHRVSLFVTADMIGRSLGGVCDSRVYVMGSEHAPGLRPWIETASKDRPVRVGLLGSDLLLIDRSDYGPFRARKVPFLFFSTGENPTYHRPEDLAETVNYETLEAISRIILGVVRQAADADEVPGWRSTADNPIEEAETIRDVITILLKHKEALKIGATKSYLMNNLLKSLDPIVKRGAITSEERSGMIRVAQIVLASLF